MKTILVTILTMSCFYGWAFSVKDTTEQKRHFQPGEILNYELTYGWIKGGEASLRLKKTKYNGKEAYHVRALGRSCGAVHALYNVRDVYESYFDPITGKPFKSAMDLKEGKYRNANEVRYNHRSRTLVSKKTGTKKMEKKDVFDIVSAFYHLRTKFDNLKVGDKVVINTYFHDEPWDLIVRFKGYQTIKTKFGKIRCMKFRPVVIEGTFESEDALDIWISDDDNRIPIRIKMKLWIGAFKTDLVSYAGLANPINFTK